MRGVGLGGASFSWSSLIGIALHFLLLVLAFRGGMAALLAFKRQSPQT